MNDFLTEIERTGSYHAPAGKYKRRKNGLWSSILVNKAVVEVFLKAGLLARKEKFGWEVWRQISGGVFMKLERMGAQIDIEGFENIDRSKLPAVYVANHMSMLETMILPPLLLTFGKVGIVLKKSLLDVPIAGRGFKSKPIVALGRSNPREDLAAILKEGDAILKSGVSMLIFPQGTRRAIFRSKQFNTIGLKLAQRAGVPIVPVALRTDLLGVGKYTKDLGPVDLANPVRFACGPMIDPAGDPKGAHRQCTEFIAGKLKEWGMPVEETTHE